MLGEVVEGLGHLLEIEGLDPLDVAGALAGPELGLDVDEQIRVLR